MRTLRSRYLLCQLAIRKTQKMRSRIHFSSSNFEKSMKLRNSAVSCLRALIGLAVFSISGQLLAQSSDWKAPPSAANRPNPLAGNANATAAGQKLYVANCVTCHGPAGKGDGPGAAALEKKPADLTARIRAGATDGELFWKISEGRSPMISWKGSLSETQRWELVNYIKSLAGK
jgi:mono/diheme cytochrome c family protein